jgi:hypothetical protein
MLSGVCLVQCLVAPLLVVLFPSAFAAFLDGESFHRALVFVVIPVSILGMVMGCRRHRQWEVLVPAVAGLLAVVTAAVGGEEQFGFFGEKSITLSGAGLLAIAHILNYRLCQRLRACPC